MSSTNNKSNGAVKDKSVPIVSRIQYRQVRPTDIPACYEIEKDSYPEDEAASKTSLQYRQHHAAAFFRCAVLANSENEDDEVVVGFICSTQCHEFNSEAMSVHEPLGTLLAIHSVVVSEAYRGNGIATAMMRDYVSTIEQMAQDGIRKLILLAKSHLLGFYVRCGFTVMRPSKIEHGGDLWYECERNLSLGEIRAEGPSCWIVDAFANSPGTGNQAAVVLLTSSPLFEDGKIEWMRSVAREFHLSETAFVWALKEDRENDGKELQHAEYGIRYFTCSGAEVDLCGHATLASGAILFQRLPFQIKSHASILFSAKQDILTLTPDLSTWNRQGRMKVHMEFPQKLLKDFTEPSDRSAILAMMKGAFHMENTAENILYMGIDEDGEDILVELTCACFQSLGVNDCINYSALTIWDGYSRGIILCCRNPATSLVENQEIEDGAQDKHELEPDFFSRFFGPKAGIDEDPVTGSAHCRLGPYFGAKLGKDGVVGRQTSTRGGTVECMLQDDGRMSISGYAVSTVSGTLLL